LSSNKTLLTTISLTLITAGIILFNFSIEIPFSSIFIFICGSFFYLGLTFIQNTGGRQRLDNLHTGEAAVLLLIVIPVILHSNNWPVWLFLLIPAAAALTWLLKNILNPFSSDILHIGSATNISALIIFLIMTYKWEVSPNIIMTTLTGPIRHTGPGMIEIVGLYLLMLLLVVPAAMFYPRFRLLSQGEVFYSSLRSDFVLTYSVSILLESLLLITTILSLGILGTAIHYLIKKKEAPLDVINTFLLIMASTQLLLLGTTFITDFSIIIAVFLFSYIFYLLSRRRIYLW